MQSSPSQRRSSNAAGETDVLTRKSEPGHRLIFVFTGVAEIKSAQKEELVELVLETVIEISGVSGISGISK